MIVNLLLFISSCFVLIVCGSLLVRSLVAISSFVRVKQFVLAYALMAISTSLPELFVGITSALAGNSALSLGTVIGSNIADLTLVAGIGVIFARKIRISKKLIRRDVWLMILIALLPMILMFLGNKLSKIDGVILLAVFAAYSLKLILNFKGKSNGVTNKPAKYAVIISSVFFIPLVILLFMSAKYVVEYGTALALDLLLPPIFVGLFFVALGTSLPELVFEAKAMSTGNAELSLGDLIGSVIINSTLVLGVTAIIFPIEANFFLFLSSAVFMVIIAFLFASFISSGRQISWIEGIALLLFYVLFLIIELSLKGIIPAMTVVN